ncbi:MAG: 2-oxoglutarate dehydrogenase complex dihydrolipoyllysine-residue succinyltransferase [Opitutales bacterium]|nr:2-oxoglutarate dehydrogenase complex dihydrolipoyllysine-residue succinyltransferase [Opitutales bacterium]NRA26257.1 2-oxoglutarate dehydrogenase complex dihydrolipoyllysine-residue succinyltransferase [Opitutales bacterium]
MATEVKIPAMGESITTGIIATWQVQDGDSVEAGQILFELETDKVTSEATAEVSGVISLKAEEGDEVEIGQVVAEIDESAADTPKKTAPTEEAAPAEASSAAEAAPSGDKPISPAVRRIASETGIDPSTVPGTGKDGRVTKGDMLAAEKAPTFAPAPVPTPAALATPPASQAAPTGERVTRKKMTALRRKIAERLVSSQQTAAILSTFNEVDMSAVMKFRKTHQEAFVAKHGIKLGFMSFFVKAVVNALKEIPNINAQIEGDEMVMNHYYDIGVAIGTDRGLVVPVVRDCDALSFAGIENAIKDYAKKGQAGKITIDDMQGGVFTISNGGTYGSLLSTPIINPPQSGILGMHSIQQRPVAVNGQVEIRPMMYLALSYDHRIVDGKEAVTFLVKIKEAIEDPTRLLFDL